MFVNSLGYQSVADNKATRKKVTKYELMPLRKEIVIKDIYIILIQFLYFWNAKSILFTFNILKFCMRFRARDVAVNQ